VMAAVALPTCSARKADRLRGGSGGVMIRTRDKRRLGLDREGEEAPRAIVAMNCCACWLVSSLARLHVSGSSRESRRNERPHPR